MKDIDIPNHLPIVIKQCYQTYILIITCFIFLTSIQLAFATEIEILECLKKITNSHFHDKMVLVLYWREHDLEAKKLNYDQKTNWMNSIIRFMVTSTDWTVYVSNQFYVEPNFDYFYFKLERQKARNIIMLLQSDSFNMTNKIRKLMENKSWNSRSKVLIVIQDDATRYDEILKNVWNFKKALDVVVMGIGGDFINFFTSYPYHRHENGTLINIWRNLRFLHNRNLYENKIPKDFQGYLLYAGTTFSEPYVLKPKKLNEYEDGVEIRIVKVLTEYCNFSIRYVASPPGQSPYVAVNKEKKPVGLFGLLYNQSIDMAFFGFRNRFDRHLLSDILNLHTQDNTVWIVPLPDPKRTWDYLYKVFSVEIWVTIFIYTFVISGTLYILRYCDMNYSKCLLETLAITINIPSPFKIFGLRLRVFIFMLYMYSLHITSAYQSFLITLWTKPMEGKPYETPQEAVKDGLISYLYPSGRPAYNRSEHEMWNKILSEGNHIYSDDYPTTLAIIARNKSAITLMIENVAKYEVSTRLLNENKKPTIHIVKKKYGPYPISIFMSLGHPLADLFNKKIQQLVEGGIVRFWLHDLLSVYERVERTSYAEYQAKKPLKLRHFEGTFLIIITGWLMSVIAFLLEYYRHKKKIIFLKFFQQIKQKCLLEISN